MKGFEVIFEDTVFFPEGGGQNTDLGCVGEDNQVHRYQVVNYCAGPSLLKVHDGSLLEIRIFEKNFSQGFILFSFLESRKVIFYFTRKFHLHNVGIHRKLYKNRFHKERPYKDLIICSRRLLNAPTKF